MNKMAISHVFLQTLWISPVNYHSINAPYSSIKCPSDAQMTLSYPIPKAAAVVAAVVVVVAIVGVAAAVVVVVAAAAAAAVVVAVVIVEAAAATDNGNNYDDRHVFRGHRFQISAGLSATPVVFLSLSRKMLR
jgi:hypothetical protein